MHDTEVVKNRMLKRMFEICGFHGGDDDGGGGGGGGGDLVGIVAV
jgi:hypothetical protein